VRCGDEHNPDVSVRSARCVILLDLDLTFKEVLYNV